VHLESNATGVLKQQLVSGCSVAASHTQEGANFQGFVQSQALALAIDSNNGTPGLSSCGSGPGLSPQATDSAGTITEGSAATACTLTFLSTTYLNPPDCIIQSMGNLAFTYALNNASGHYTGFTITNVGALAGHSLVYHCILHL
jgi:hypothetical protein